MRRCLLLIAFPSASFVRAGWRHLQGNTLRPTNARLAASSDWRSGPPPFFWRPSWAHCCRVAADAIIARKGEICAGIVDWEVVGRFDNFGNKTSLASPRLFKEFVTISPVHQYYSTHDWAKYLLHQESAWAFTCTTSPWGRMRTKKWITICERFVD